MLGVPIIVEWSVFTLPQEVAVCKWVLNRGLGLGFTRKRQLLDQVNRMCDMLKLSCGDPAPTALGTGGGMVPVAKHAAKHVQQRPVPISEKGLTGFDYNPIENSAVFEVPAIIQDILDVHTAPGTTTAAT